MPSFRTGKVLRLLEERTGLQRAEVDLGDGPEKAYVLTQLTGRVDAGDPVVVNTTAVELGLGTGTLLGTLLLVQAVGVPGALLFGRFARAWSANSSASRSGAAKTT
mgnify:CR=1 FL=1